MAKDIVNILITDTLNKLKKANTRAKQYFVLLDLVLEIKKLNNKHKKTTKK